METNKNAFLVGLFVLATIAVAVGFTLWLTAANRGERMIYRVYFAESVGGLTLGSAVKFNGVDVGEVKELAVDEEDIKQVRVDINIRKDAPVKKETIARLTLQGLTGGVFIELEGGKAEDASLASLSKEEPPVIRSGPSSVNTLMTLLPSIMKKTDHTMGQLEKLFSDKNVKRVNGVVHTASRWFGDDEDEDKPKEKPVEKRRFQQ